MSTSQSTNSLPLIQPKTLSTLECLYLGKITPDTLKVSFATEIDNWNSIAFPTELGTSLAHLLATSNYYNQRMGLLNIDLS